LVDRQIGRLICIAIPNFTKIGQTVAEISYLTISKMAAVCHIGFFKVWFFEQLVSSGGLIYAIMQNFVKIGQTVCEISRFINFQDGRRPFILDFEIFTFLVSHQVERSMLRHRTKFHQNRSNGCRDLAFNVFLNGGRPPFKMAAVRHFWFVGQILRLYPQREFDGLYHCAKFGYNRISCFVNRKVWIFCAFDLKTAIHAPFLAVLGVKIVSEFLSLLKCNNPELTSYKANREKSFLRYSLGTCAKFGVTKKDRIGKVTRGPSSG